MKNENPVRNKVKVTIAGNQFTVISEEDESYTQGIADELNESINEIKSANKSVSTTAAVILTALNYCDIIKQSGKDSETLRKQLEEYLENAAKDKETISELRAENEKLKKDIETYRKRLSDSGHNGAPVSTAVKSAQKTISQQEEAAEDETEFFYTESKDPKNSKKHKNKKS